WAGGCIAVCLSDRVARLEGPHRADLEHLNGFIVMAVPRLAKNKRSRRVELDRNRNDRQQRRQHQQSQSGNRDVKCPLQSTVEGRQGRVSYLDGRDVAEFGDACGSEEIEPIGKDDVNADGQHRERCGQSAERRQVLMLCDDEYVVESKLAALANDILNLLARRAPTVRMFQETFILAAGIVE